MRNEAIWTRRYREDGARAELHEEATFSISKVITRNRYGKSQAPVYKVHTITDASHDVVALAYSGEYFFTFQSAKAFGMDLTKKRSIFFQNR